MRDRLVFPLFIRSQSYTRGPERGFASSGPGIDRRLKSLTLRAPPRPALSRRSARALLLSFEQAIAGVEEAHRKPRFRASFAVAVTQALANMPP